MNKGDIPSLLQIYCKVQTKITIKLLSHINVQ